MYSKRLSNQGCSMFIRIFFFEKCRDGKKVAVVYYRAGYTPNDYPSEAVWVLWFFPSHIAFSDRKLSCHRLSFSVRNFVLLDMFWSFCIPLLHLNFIFVLVNKVKHFAVYDLDALWFLANKVKHLPWQASCIF
jgi:hypothetical protein